MNRQIGISANTGLERINLSSPENLKITYGAEGTESCYTNSQVKKFQPSTLEKLFAFTLNRQRRKQVDKQMDKQILVKNPTS